MKATATPARKTPGKAPVGKAPVATKVAVKMPARPGKAPTFKQDIGTADRSRERTTRKRGQRYLS
jgi:hypothetical protein